MKFCSLDDVIIQVVFLVTVAGLRICSSINIASNAEMWAHHWCVHSASRWQKRQVFYNVQSLSEKWVPF